MTGLWYIVWYSLKIIINYPHLLCYREKIMIFVARSSLIQTADYFISFKVAVYCPKYRKNALHLKFCRASRNDLHGYDHITVNASRSVPASYRVCGTQAMIHY